MKLARPLVASTGAILFFLACSSSTDPTGGIALTLATDGSINPDRINVKVSNATSTFYASDLAIGAGVLPKTVNVTATGSAAITIQAWSGSTALDRRDLTVAQVPTGRLQPYTVLLSGKCTSHVRTDGDIIVSDCASGTTCSPTDGACTSSDVSSAIASPDGGAVDNGSCVPTSAKCGPDGISVQTCNANGIGYGAAVSCNGTTCVDGKCSTCSVGNESCGGGLACTPGTGRCTGTPAVTAEICTETGTWKTQAICPYACQAGKCVGVCGPGATQCATKNADGTVGGENIRIDACVSGNCADPNHPLAVVVRSCNEVGQWVEGANCDGACFPSMSSKTVACGYCGNGVPPQAMCLPSISGACNCPGQ